MKARKARKHRASPSWKKLLVDNKLIYVFPSSRVPASVRVDLSMKLVGIRLEEATKEERAPFLKAEKKRRAR